MGYRRPVINRKWALNKGCVPINAGEHKHIFVCDYQVVANEARPGCSASTGGSSKIDRGSKHFIKYQSNQDNCKDSIAHILCYKPGHHIIFKELLDQVT